jgi:hypothetical protein
LNGARTGAKAGFDLTLPFGRRHENEFCVPEVPKMGPLRDETVGVALKSGPKSFLELMEATGNRDGRDVLIALDEIRSKGTLGRAPDGRYALKQA